MNANTTNCPSEGLAKDLFEALDSLAALQQTQIREMALSDGKKIRGWRESHQKACDRLQFLLVRMNGQLVGDADFRTSFLRRMGDVLAGEADLRRGASLLRERIGRQLRAIRRGKKTLRGYTLRGPENLPRFLSSRT
ncbi:MAG: hypothetical protein M0017_07970 [Desulfobacteraceae bacterium]|nr:hypothetical protein [Desulfobacteraceae bacterium]